MLIFTLVILQVTATRKHRCPMCERELGSDGKFLVFFKDEVYSFAIGMGLSYYVRDEWRDCQ
jgi:hypothetical protein